MGIRSALRHVKARFLTPWLMAQSENTWAGRLIQAIYDGRSLTPPASLSGRIRTRVYASLSRWITRLGDPLVMAPIAGRRLWLPFSHQGPEFCKAYPLADTNVARIAGAVAAKYPDLAIIDVGANIGDTLALIRQQTAAPVLCIEGEPGYYSVLQKNAALFAAAYPVQAFIGEANTTIRAQVRRKAGTARIRPGVRADPVALRTLPAVLEEQPAFRRAKLLKTDTDGFEGKVLAGAAPFLAEARPVVFFEYDPDLLALYGDGGLMLFGLLRWAGYRGLILYENTGVFLLSAATSEERRLAEIHLYISGQPGRFLDVCAFHAEDDDLFEDVRQSEFRFFARHKGGAAE